MKIGYRKPNFKKSIKSRTTGRIKRSINKSITPIYGKKGVGFAKNPKKSIQQSIYHKTTFDTTKNIKDSINKTNFSKSSINNNSNTSNTIKIDKSGNNIKTDCIKREKNDVSFSPTTEKIINIISYIIAFIIITFILITISSFIIGIIQGINNNI